MKSTLLFDTGGRRQRHAVLFAVFCLALAVPLASCGKKSDVYAAAASDTGPHPAAVEPDMDANNFKVDHPDQFPVVSAVEHRTVPRLNVTGVVQPDITRAVPV